MNSDWTETTAGATARGRDRPRPRLALRELLGRPAGVLGFGAGCSVLLGLIVGHHHLGVDHGTLWETGAITLLGLGFSLLAAGHTLSLHRRLRDAEADATAMTGEVQRLSRRLAEKELALASLREGERRYRDFYENAVEGIFTTTPDGRFVSANPALVRLLGFRDEGDLVATLRDTARQLYVDPERREAFVRAVLEAGSVTGFAAEVRRKDGSTLWMELTARAVRDAAGRLVAFQGTAQDVTERHRAAEALRHAKEQADLANRAKSEFLANMSHELRTPLNAIIGFSEIIGNQTLGPIEDPSYAEYARDIHDSGKLLLDLINDILDLSKIEAGKKELHERSVDVPRVIWSCLRLVRERALAGGITLETDLPESLPPVRADEVALKQVLSNLLTNAVKFTQAGGRVTAGARVAPDGRLMLTVRDTGIGMDPDDIPRAMEPFRQLESHLTRAAGGAGLGLPLVQALVALHEGSFTLDSRKGAGTTATVWLPADRLQRLAATTLVPAR